MRVIFLGKDSPVAIEGLAYLIACGIEVVAVVDPEQGLATSAGSLADAAEAFGIPRASDSDLYAMLKGTHPQRPLPFTLDSIDLVLSVLFWKRIKPPLIALPTIGCLNFHPAPLPDVRGVSGYTLAIYEQMTTWGVSAHFVDDTFDTGDLIKVTRFAITPQNETAHSLQQQSYHHLLTLFTEIIAMCLNGTPLPRTPQTSGRYFSRKAYHALRQIYPNDSLETIERKIRACWYPPHGGATIHIYGKPFTLINEDIVAEMSALIGKSGG